MGSAADAKIAQLEDEVFQLTRSNNGNLAVVIGLLAKFGDNIELPVDLLEGHDIVGFEVEPNIENNTFVVKQVLRD